jgi:muramidase (phage lysozyme)
MSGESKRTNREKLEKSIGPGPYEAVVVSNLDPHYMGSLKVDILKGGSSGSIPNKIGTSIIVKYLSPFYGVTNPNHTTPNDGYASSQKSYGFWAVPPDPGARVLVIFAEGDVSQGYWIGCIQDKHMNFMVPDGKASTTITTNGTPNNIKGRKLPVGEYNKYIEKGEARDPTKFPKPYNKDFTQVLEVQGLLNDDNRGTTSTSARREVPSSVFGISTPGPVDKRDFSLRGLAAGPGSQSVFVNRLGGSSFVMDDGDNTLIRKTHASEGPPEYVNVEAGEKNGDRTLLHNELVRFRTRTGHQIVMHNTEDFVYIGNSRGTAWVELTSDGKIDIYGSDSISIHSDADINLSADRDVNIEGGRNVNIRASARATNGSAEGGTSGNVQIESKYDTNILVEQNMKTEVAGYQETKVTGYQKTLVEGDIHHHTNANLYILADVQGHIRAVDDLHVNTDANLHASGKNTYLSASEGAVNIKASANIEQQGVKINMNSGDVTPATASTDAEDATPVVPLNTHAVPKVTPGTTVASDVSSIVKRMPSHEPWPHHENLNPMAFKPIQTDVLNTNPTQSGSLINAVDTFRKSLNTANFSGTGGSATGTATTTARSGTSQVTSSPNNFPPANYSAVGAFGNLLDVIGNAESSGYNTIYSGSKISTPKPLIQMTVAEVQQWQDDSVAAGSASSAVGRYQFIRKTLKSLIGVAISEDELFNQDAQDRAAKELLSRRKINDFIKGTKSEAAMAKSIAQEWASMPVINKTQGSQRIVNPGESYYSGDGLNKSLISTEELVAALRNAKQTGQIV